MIAETDSHQSEDVLMRDASPNVENGVEDMDVDMKETSDVNRDADFQALVPG